MSVSILVAIDGSDASNRAVDQAIEYARLMEARLVLMHVVHWSGYVPIGVEAAYNRPMDKKAEEDHAHKDVLDPALEKAKHAGIDSKACLTWGSPAAELTNKAQEIGARLVVVGRKGRTNLAEMIIGSVSNAIAHVAKVPVLLVP